MKKVEINPDILIQSDVRENNKKIREQEEKHRYFEEKGMEYGIKPATLASIKVGDMDQVSDDAVRGRVDAASVEVFLLVAEEDGFVPNGMHARFARRYRFFDEASSNEAGFGWNR
jgi:hypothetical protein